MRLLLAALATLTIATAHPLPMQGENAMDVDQPDAQDRRPQWISDPKTQSKIHPKILFNPLSDGFQSSSLNELSPNRPGSKVASQSTGRNPNNVDRAPILPQASQTRSDFYDSSDSDYPIGGRGRQASAAPSSSTQPPSWVARHGKWIQVRQQMTRDRREKNEHWQKLVNDMKTRKYLEKEQDNAFNHWVMEDTERKRELATRKEAR